MASDESQTLLAFASFLLATGATVATLVAWLRGWSGRRFWLLSSAVGLLACGLEISRSAAVYWAASSTLPSFEITGFLAGTYLLGAPLLVAILRLRAPGAEASAVSGGRLLAAHLLMTVAAWWHFQRLQAEPWDEIPTRAELLNREQVEDTELVTDQGRAIPLFRSLVQGPVEIESLDSHSAAWRNVKRVAAADRKANCHGWVFAAGEYLVEAEHVDWILRDNGYHTVEQPQAGDLIIYRYDDGTPMHSGIVRLVQNDGTPVIESKWGLGGRYLHPPENPLYHGRIEYYRGPQGSDGDRSEETGRVQRRPRFISMSSP